MKDTSMAASEFMALCEREAKARAVPEVRRREKMEIGERIRQGDIYVQRVSDNHPRGKQIENRQLAVGSTSGSRHVLTTGSATVYEGTTPAPGQSESAVQILLGPCIESKSDRVYVSHPEHAHLDLPPGTYQVNHQLDARTMQRVSD